MNTFTAFQGDRPADQPFHVDLPAQAILTLPDAAGVVIECRRGAVWITLDHDLRDIVLAPGQRFEGMVHRRAMVSALAPSCIAVSGAEPAGLPMARRHTSPRRRAALGLSPA